MKKEKKKLLLLLLLRGALRESLVRVRAHSCWTDAVFVALRVKVSR